MRIDNAVVPDVDEGCDDSNTVSGDGCSSTCQIEPCWSCAGEPSVCAQSFTTTTVDASANDVGARSALAIGTDGFPIVAYLDNTADALKAIHCTNATCTTADPPVMVDGAGDVSQVDMAIGDDGLPIISYHLNSSADLRVAHCSTPTCSARTITTLDSPGDVGKFSSIAIGADGLALISYFDQTNGNLKVAHCSNVACSLATISTLDSSGVKGAWTALAIGPDGFGVISYQDGDTSGLKAAHCTNALCSSATLSAVEAGEMDGYSAIGIGAGGRPLISYRGISNTDLRVAYCSDADCSGATVSAVDTGNVGTFSTLVVGADDRALIGYYDLGNADLKMARCADAACSSAARRTIDSAGTVGQHTSMAQTPGGAFVISYQDVTNGNLKVASCGPAVGDGSISPNEECDDGNLTNGDGCSSSGTIDTCWTCSGEPSSCAPASSGSSCPQDGLFCNGTETCNGSGSCISGSDPCSGGGECADVCNEAADNCFDPNGTPCSDEPNPCTVDACDGAGICAHTPGNAGTICRPDAGACDVAETCDGSNAACPADGFEAGGTPCGNPANDDCTDPDTCDGSGTCQVNHAAGGSPCANDGNPCTTDQCDGGGSCLHPAGNAGTECRPNTGQCDVPETCDGSSTSCPPDGFEDSGTPCDDGSVCTQTDQCDGSGECAGSNPLNCDDSNACTANDCDPVNGCENAPAPATGCKSAAKAILILKGGSGASDKQLFKWVNGDILTLADLQDPTTSTTYGICMFEGPSNELLESISVPPGAPNWQAAGTIGYKYKDLTGTNSGITKMLFRGNDTAGKSKALVKGKGDNLPDPTLGDMQTPVTVQVINPDTGACVEAVFDSGDVKKNTSTLFKAKAQTP